MHPRRDFVVCSPSDIVPASFDKVYALQPKPTDWAESRPQSDRATHQIKEQRLPPKTLPACVPLGDGKDKARLAGQTGLRRVSRRRRLDVNPDRAGRMEAPARVNGRNQANGSEAARSRAGPARTAAARRGRIGAARRRGRPSSSRSRPGRPAASGRSPSWQTPADVRRGAGRRRCDTARAASAATVRYAAVFSVRSPPKGCSGLLTRLD